MINRTHLVVVQVPIKLCLGSLCGREMLIETRRGRWRVEAIAFIKATRALSVIRPAAWAAHAIKYIADTKILSGVTSHPCMSSRTRVYIDGKSYDCTPGFSLFECCSSDTSECSPKSSLPDNYSGKRVNNESELSIMRYTYCLGLVRALLRPLC